MKAWVIKQHHPKKNLYWDDYARAWGPLSHALLSCTKSEAFTAIVCTKINEPFKVVKVEIKEV